MRGGHTNYYLLPPNYVLLPLSPIYYLLISISQLVSTMCFMTKKWCVFHPPPDTPPFQPEIRCAKNYTYFRENY